MNFNVMLIVVLALCLGCISVLAVSEQAKCAPASVAAKECFESNPGNLVHADIYQINEATRGVSRYYLVNTTNGIHQVYCEMELECGGYKGGWMRIADYDTSRGDSCPSGWNITNC